MRQKQKSTVILITAVLLCVSALLGCEDSTSGLTTLENGTTITAEERTSLEALGPDFETLVANFQVSAASRDWASEEDYNEALITEIKTFMQEQFGEDYTKYIIEGEIVLDEIELSDVDSRNFNIPMGTGFDGDVHYMAIFSAKYCKLPWGSWGWADSSFWHTFVSNPEYTVSMSWIPTDAKPGIRTRYYDSVSSVDSGTLVNSSANATGKMHYGWFPSFTATSKHNVSHTNSSVGTLYRVYSLSTP